MADFDHWNDVRLAVEKFWNWEDDGPEGEGWRSAMNKATHDRISEWIAKNKPNDCTWPRCRCDISPSCNKSS